MGQDDTLQHMLQHYAMYLNSLLAQVLTLKKIMTHLAELAPFVNSKHCPRVSKTYGNAHMAQLDRYGGDVGHVALVVPLIHAFGCILSFFLLQC